MNDICTMYILFPQIKGLADVASKEEDDGGGGKERLREGSGSSSTPPPAKRPKPSPVDSLSLGQEGRDQRGANSRDPRPDLRDVRDLPNFSMVPGGYPRRPTSPPGPPLPSSTSLTPARSLLYSSSLMSRPSSKSPGPALSAPPFFPGGLVRPRSPHPQYDPTAGSSLLPPRTSPQSPVPDHKMVQQLG